MLNRQKNFSVKSIRIFSLVLTCLFLTLTLTSYVCAEDEFSLKSEFTFDGKSLAEYASVEGKPEIVGYSAYALNLNSGTVVYEKNSLDAVYPASTVKLMTAIVAYENIPDLDVEITANQSAVSKAQGANMAIKAGETLTARELFYGLLVRGANDAALVLAEYVAGSEQDFCTLMNEKAKQIGANDSHFENVTGFHEESMVTTARDIGRIAGYLYYIPELFDMTNTTRYVVEPTEKTNEKRTLINRNMLLSRVISEDYYYSAAKGMSLGSTPEGGYCGVSTVTSRDGMTYLCVVMNSKETDGVNYACKDLVSMFRFCTENFSYQAVASKQDVMCEMPVKNAVDVDHIALFPDADIRMLLPNNMEYGKDITLEKRLYEKNANAPVNRSDVFGEVVVKYKGQAAIGRARLVSGVAVDRSNVLYFLSRIENIVTGTWFVVFAVTAVILFAVYFGLSVYYRYFRKGKYSRSRRKK